MCKSCAIVYNPFRIIFCNSKSSYASFNTNKKHEVFLYFMIFCTKIDLLVVIERLILELHYLSTISLNSRIHVNLNRKT